VSVSLQFKITDCTSIEVCPLLIDEIAYLFQQTDKEVELKDPDA
jgi:hypothetical protein